MSDELTLAAEFPAPTRDDWLKLVRAALKDRPFERLIAKTYDGLAIEPLYPRAAHAGSLSARSGPWQVMARADHPDPAAANEQLTQDLENGATGVALVFPGAIGCYGNGLDASAAGIAKLLDGVFLDVGIGIELYTAETTKQAADHVAALVKSRGHKPGSVNIRFGHDPLGAHAAGGGAPIPWRDLSPRFAEHVAALAAQGFTGPLTVADGRIVHNAGGSEAQELAYALSVAVAYLRALEAAGVPLGDARGMIGFRMSADSDEFLTIAKFRALRLLWARVEQSCGLEPKPAVISAETAWRTMTRRDPYSNMLRACIAAFSAGVGGADALTVLPFTQALGLPDAFARRNARNLQLLLLEESNVWRVDDPAAGSGAIEDLTAKLALSAWTLLQEIEAAGGAPAALESGLIQKKVAATREVRERAFATRREILTGTSDYPLLSEAAVEVLKVKPLTAAPYPVAIPYPPLQAIRLGEPFERLRDAADAVLASTGKRPSIFLANLGTPADFNARAMFAKNFFEAGGIETIGNEGFADESAMIDAFEQSGAGAACLCSSDDIYAERAVAAAEALKAAGATPLYLSGRPKDQEPLTAAGIGSFIFVGCDVLAILRAAHDMMGIGKRPS
jgi:methylmalonyl-CoA mutase